MAEGRDKMYKYIYLSYYEFNGLVEKLVDHVMLQVDPPYIYTLRYLNRLRLSTFEEEICRAICIIVSKILTCCRRILYEWRDRFEMSSSNLVNLADGLETLNFRSGFNGRSFLIQVASICCIGAIFFMNGLNVSPRLTKRYIISLIKNRMTIGGWDAVLEAARECWRIFGNEY